MELSFTLSLLSDAFCTIRLNACRFQIEVDKNGKIVDARFKTFGCGSAIASSSLATEWVKGKSVSGYSANEEGKEQEGLH